MGDSDKYTAITLDEQDWTAEPATMTVGKLQTILAGTDAVGEEPGVAGDLQAVDIDVGGIETFPKRRWDLT